MPEEVKVNTSTSAPESAALHEEYGAHLPNLGDEGDQAKSAGGQPSQVISEAKPDKAPKVFLATALGLIGICLVGVAAMAYLGYQSQQQLKDAQQTYADQMESFTRQLNEAKAKLAEAEAKANQVEDITPKLNLTELGVQLPLAEGLKDLTYVKLASPASDPTAIVVGFSSASLVTACGTISKCAASQAPLGTLSRTSQAKRPSGGYTNGKLVTTLGGYDFVYNEGTKLTKPTAAQSLQANQTALLSTQVTQLSLIK